MLSQYYTYDYGYNYSHRGPIGDAREIVAILHNTGDRLEASTHMFAPELMLHCHDSSIPYAERASSLSWLWSLFGWVRFREYCGGGYRMSRAKLLPGSSTVRLQTRGHNARRIVTVNLQVGAKGYITRLKVPAESFAYVIRLAGEGQFRVLIQKYT